jgi:orotate phosphoribosyltransferase
LAKIMNPDAVLELFEKTGALLHGHFLLSSGLHSRQYFQCAKVLQYPPFAEQLCSEIAAHFAKSNIAAVAAPALGGIIVAHETARHLSEPDPLRGNTRAIFTEREGGSMALRRGFEIQKGERVLVVEDVITTGGSLAEVIALVKALGGEIAGAACIVDRSGGRADLGVEVFSLIQLNIETMPPERCALCRQGAPLVKPGSRTISDG